MNVTFKNKIYAKCCYLIEADSHITKYNTYFSSSESMVYEKWTIWNLFNIIKYMKK